MGSLFETNYRWTEAGIVPTIKGRAHITGDTSVVLDPEDPFRFGFESESTVSSTDGSGKPKNA